MTSSVAAVAYGNRPARGVHTFTEADWTPPDFPGATPYVRSKTISERAARDWVAKEGGGIEYCSVNPSVVFGPVWSNDYSPSVMVLRRLLDGSLRACPDVGFGVVDVRDVTAIDPEVAFTPRRDFRLKTVVAHDCDKLLNGSAFSCGQCVICLPIQHYRVSRSNAVSKRAPLAWKLGATGRACLDLDQTD
jgi:hypothetical protein